VLRATAHDPSLARSAVLDPQLQNLLADSHRQATTMRVRSLRRIAARSTASSAANAASSSMKDITIPPDALTRFRAAASEFARSAKSRASRLQAVCDDIAALRAKGASFRPISELLGRCGIRASDTCVMRFCQRVLGETPVRARKAKARAAPRSVANTPPNSAESANGHVAQSTASAVSEAAQGRAAR
jgi:hypothetical protein